MLAIAAGVAMQACRSGPPSVDTALPALGADGGLETVLLRIPMGGGLPRSYRWPRVDDAIWVGRDRLPPLGSVLAFDQTGGLVALATDEGRPVRLDLRSGLVQLPGTVMSEAASADGWSLYGVSADGRLLRNTPTADWRGPMARADSVIALPGGPVVLISHQDNRTRLIRLRPPAASPRDTLEIDRATQFVRSLNGDRIYAMTEDAVVAIDTRTWQTVRAPSPARVPLAIAPTPSGDRVFVLERGGREVRIWQRYSERFAGEMLLPAASRDVRMDPLGRFLLVRADSADSVYVVSVPLERLVGTLATEWREDLPTIAPDGSVLALRRGDVFVYNALTGAQKRRVRGGASDYWTFVRWDGFRPRDRSLDAPAVFETDTPADSAAAAEAIDSLLAANALRVAAEIDSIGRASAGRRLQEDSTAVAAAGGYTLSFASLLSEASARVVAERIRVDGRRPRVVASSSDGVTIYRVVVGPFETREAAVAAGQRSGVPFWVFPGLP